MRGDDVRARRGQIAGWVAAATLMVFGMALIWNERQLEGLIALALVVGPYVGASVWRGVSSSHERANRTAQMLMPLDDDG